MKKLSMYLLPLVLLVIFACGCQPQSQSKQVVSKRDRLVGDENLRLKNEIQTLNQSIETQKQQLANCEQEKQKIQADASRTADFLLKQMPKQTIEENKRLQAENKQLLERIAQLKKANRSQDVNSPQ